MTDTFDATWLAGTTYDALRAADFERFCEAASTDLTARVPTCPDWDMTGLCDHLARVYQGRGYVIAHAEFLDSDRFELRGDDDDPIEWLRRWSDALDGSLEGLADDAPTITFVPAARIVHFWRRRMALETLVHRTDAELAIGGATTMDDTLSADGCDELLWFLSEFSEREPAPDHDDGIASASVVQLTDGARSWLRDPHRRGGVVGGHLGCRGRDRARLGACPAARALGPGPRRTRSVAVWRRTARARR